MHSNTMRLLLLTLLFCFLTGDVIAYNIFVWDHDNSLNTYDPVFRTNLDATTAVTRTLDGNNIDYDINRNLPDDLSDYDVVIVCLSFYCPG